MYASTDPAGVLFVTRTCLEPLVCLLHRVEKCASEAWAEKQLHDFKTGKTPQATTRADAMLDGKFCGECYLSQEELMHDAERWTALPYRFKTISYMHTAFSQLSRGMCGVDQLVDQVLRRYPFKLLRRGRADLFVPLGETVLRDCNVAKDTFTLTFIAN